MNYTFLIPNFLLSKQYLDEENEYNMSDHEVSKFKLNEEIEYNFISN